MIRYVVDGAALNPEEAARHRGACNAALSGTLSATRPDADAAAIESVALAFDHADEVVREHRRRIERAYAPIDAPCETYALASREEVVAAWAEGVLELTVSRNVAIGRLRELNYPRTLKEIVERSGIRHDVARELVAVGVLVRAESRG